MSNTPNAPRQLPPVDFTIGDASIMTVFVSDDDATFTPTEWTPIGPWVPGPTIVIPKR